MASHVAMNAAMELVAMRLCPQAWPMPGNASYSALKATTRPPSPSSSQLLLPRVYVISNAVSTPYAFRWIWNRLGKTVSKKVQILSWASYSLKASSGFSQI